MTFHIDSLECSVSGAEVGNNSCGPDGVAALAAALRVPAFSYLSVKLFLHGLDLERRLGMILGIGC